MPKGFKPCKNCAKQNPLRASKCECGYEFVKASAAVPASSETMTIGVPVQVPNLKEPEKIVESKRTGLQVYNTLSGRKRTIYTPSGECPVKPKGFVKDNWQATDEVIKEWAEETFKSGDYLPEAVVYFARYYWDINSPEFDRIEELIFKTLKSSQNSEQLVEV